MRIYYDTEFTSLEGNVDWDLISAGFVAEDGREWYAEITDFNRYECSPFVVETVLPLLDGRLDQRMPGAWFAPKLCGWLASFGEDIELVSDAGCDWFLVNGYCHRDFADLPFRVQARTWQRSDVESIELALQEVEAAFWRRNSGKQHHALWDARRLKVLVEAQRAMLA